MKIVAISDTHGHEIRNLPQGDLLIHSGDWSGAGTYKETSDFILWLSKIRASYKKVVCVPGNHDKWVEANQDQATKEFKSISVDLLIDQETYHGGHMIYGMPWTPEFNYWSFMANDIERSDYCSRIPKDTDILVTHGPPMGYLDTIATNGSLPGVSAGCQFIREAVIRVEPKVHIFGHIHEGAGVQRLGKTLLINAASVNEYYRPTSNFTVIYL